jgi:hypothetical protein
MFDPDTSLVSRLLESCIVELRADPAAAAPWARAREGLESVRKTDPDVAAAIEASDFAALQVIVQLWDAGKRPLPPQDIEVMRRAMKAFRKSLKVTRLDDESKIGRNPMTDGGGSSILGITAPPRFSRDVWSELVRRGELRGGRQGVYELAKE